MRADPKKTTVSWMFCALKRRSGSRYSARMRIGRASSLSRNCGSRYASGCGSIPPFCYDSPSRLTEFSTSLVIVAPPAAVIDAFFNPRALAVWWQATRSLCVPRPLGSYAVEWVTTDFSDDVLGRLGGALHGTVM